MLNAVSRVMRRTLLPATKNASIFDTFSTQKSTAFRHQSASENAVAVTDQDRTLHLENVDKSDVSTSGC